MTQPAKLWIEKDGDRYYIVILDEDGEKDYLEYQDTREDAERALASYLSAPRADGC